MRSGTVVTLGRPLGAALLFAGLLLAGLGAVAWSWADLSAATEERDAKADLLQRGAAAGRRARPATAPAADPFVRGDTATLAAAAVDSDLRARAAAAGLSLLSSRAEAKPDEPGGTGAAGVAGAAGGIGVRIEDQAVVEGQNEALQALLVALETGEPTMLVDDIAVEPAAVEGLAAADPQAPRLRASLTLSGYWRPGPAVPAAAVAPPPAAR